MALKALMLRKRIDAKKKELEALRGKAEDFKRREAEIVASINEAETEEERAACEETTNQYDADVTANNEAVAKLESEIADLEGDLAAEEAKQGTTPAGPEKSTPTEERKDTITMSTRHNFFRNMSIQERDAFFAREDVKTYLGEIRSCIREKRALTNVGLTIPQVFLGLLRENIEGYSKLYRHVNVRRIGGNGRAVIMGTIPEAVWTDCCGELNELDLSFNDAEFGCWKVGGFYAVCNATLEDSDIDLASELMTALGQAIGRALDKAILYGGGSRMPLGIMTRLAQTQQPSGYSATARPWADLHTSNIKTLPDTLSATSLFREIVLASGAAKGKYSRGAKTWVMNETTYTFIMAHAMSIDASGAIVSGVESTMPVIGGAIVVVNDLPDYVIIGGYYDLYTLTERGGQQFATSEHVRFLADQTVFKGTARYDGQPVIAEAFVAIGLNGVTPTAEMTFADDVANTVQSIALNTSTATVVKNKTVQIKATTYPVAGAVAYASSDTSKATVDANGVVTGVAVGSVVITATCNGLTASATVTVTAS